MTGLLPLFQDYTFHIVALGCALFGIISGTIGCFAVLRRQSLLGDGISHAAHPGIIIAFMLTGNKNTEVLLLGALITGLLSVFIINNIIKHTRVKFDSALALVLSVFFGLGMTLLTYSQKIPNANQAGLTRFIYGQASTLLLRDIVIIAVSGSVMLCTVILFWKEFKLLSFDSEFAESLGLKTDRIKALLSILTVITIIIGLQTVGAVLMSAMLISPAVAARQWTGRLSTMVILAAVFGAFSGALGAAFSIVTPGIPTGPSIVICISAISIISILFAPNRGVIAKVLRRISIAREGENESRI